jgi:hypothetical protein
MSRDEDREDRPVRSRPRGSSPEDDPDEDERSPARHRRTRRRDDDEREESNAGVGLAVLKWGALAVGCLLAVVALEKNAVQAAALSGLACFLGIASRIFQAEQHRAMRDDDRR